MKIVDPLVIKLRPQTDQLRIDFLQEQGERPRQEDVCLVFSDECVVLADGVGGMPHGEVAAILAAETAIWAYKHIRQRPYYWNDKKLFMKRIFRTCNMTVWQKQREVGFQDGMATTLLVAILGPQYFWLGTSGDTAGYVWHHGDVRQLTPPNRDEFGALTKALGVKRLGLIPEYASGKFEKGDALILATDGVWDYVTTDDLALALQQKEPAAAGRMLLDAARAAGSTDNRTIAVVRRIAVS